MNIEDRIKQDLARMAKQRKEPELERQVEAKLRNGIKALGGVAYKFVSPGNSGVPDRIVILPSGRLVFVELKRKGQKPTALQQAQIERLKALGQDVRICVGVEDVQALLEELKA